MVGKPLAHYQVIDKLGAGGMGEVYRARDTRLGRDVAIKLLPDAFAQNPERLARFEREAQLLAALNHPNIAAIHGLEESEGRRFLVLEYVPGETLSGPLPVDEVLALAGQLIDALEEAHERGIVHRDLKPANIKITPDGKVKVLDFGLAKAMLGDPVDEVASDSPTLAATALTRGAVLLGTAAYMSPEQARGKRVDKRSDIFAFGAVLYEMVTGRQAFGGETISDSLAAILKNDPDWSALPEATSGQICPLVRRCLEKDPRRRLRDIGDARMILDTEPVSPSPGLSVSASRLPWAVAALALVVGAVATWAWLRGAPQAPRPVLRLSTPLAADLGSTPAVALSRDGTKLAFVSGELRQAQIQLRLLDRLDARPIPGTGGSRGSFAPFFSPDGQWLGFTDGYTQVTLKKVQIAGGAVITIADGSSLFGADWGRDGAIIFGARSAGLSRVSAAGGKPEVLTTPDPKKGEGAHRWPHILPDGGAVLFTIGEGGSDAGQNYDNANIAVLSLKTREQRVLVEGGTSPRFVPAGKDGEGPGYLVYWRAGSLFAVPFDPGRLQLTGSVVPILEEVSGSGASGRGDFSFSDTGVLVYVPGTPQGINNALVSVDRQGKEQPLGAPPRRYREAALSPDGRRVAVAITGRDQSDIWVYDVGRTTLTRLTFQGDNTTPVWTPDGSRVAFSSEASGKTSLAWVAADGTGPAETLAAVEGTPYPWCFSPDGKLLIFVRSDPRGRDTWLLPVEGDRTPRRWQETPFGKVTPQYSPDGRWLAYSSASEVFVQAAPSPGTATAPAGRWQVSTDGGSLARWSRDGRELFYRNGNSVMAVGIEAGSAPSSPFQAGTPRLLFEGPYLPITWDISPDGKRFLMIRPAEPEKAADQLHFVVEWFEEVRRRVQAGGVAGPSS